MADFPDNVVYKIKGNSIISELIYGMELMVERPELRENLSARALDYLKKKHSPELCSKKYFNAIEKFYLDKSHDLPLRLSQLDCSNIFKKEHELDYFINALLQTCLPSYRTKTIFIDVSEIIRGDIRTGIQRVVRNLLRVFTENNLVRTGSG